MICDLAGSRTSTWKHTASRRKSSGHGNGTWRRTWTSWCGYTEEFVVSITTSWISVLHPRRSAFFGMLRNLDGWVPRGRNIAEETWCTVAFSGCQPNVCPFDYLQCGADDGFGMLLELLQETEKASIIRTAAYLRNLQQAAQADSLSNATWLTFKAVARTPKWPSATLGDRCFFA